MYLLENCRSFDDGLLDTDEKFRALVEHSLTGIYILKDGIFSYVNDKFLDIFGYTREEIIGKSNLEFTYEEDREIASENIRKRIEGKTDSIEYTFRVVAKNNEIKYIRAYGSVFTYEGERAIIGSLIDETETVLAKKNLEKLAKFDNLTGLFNRYVFLLEFKRAVELGGRREHKVALIMFDIDNFKRINDSLGHDMGDAILVQVGKRIKKTLRGSDLLARIGGDEFAIIVEDYKNTNEIGSLIRRIQKTMEESISAGSISLHLSLSIGVALYPKHGNDIDALQKAADIAMYEAKKNGKNRYAFYSSDNNVLYENIQMEHSLAFALERGEIKLFLQPQINLKNGKICCAEALIRWNHPEKGTILPGRFLPIAGESGLLYKLDLFMIESVFKLLAEWNKNLKQTPVSLSVNISNALFHHQQFLPTVKEMKKRYGDYCKYIEMELTEEIIMENETHTDQLISSLKELGFRLSIDDFGTGRSSLSHLKKLDIDKIKIDRTFVSDITHNDDDRVIVEAIVAIGKAMNLTVLAEGAEDQDQVELLKEIGCSTVQGFYYAKPKPVEIFESRWLGSGENCSISCK